MIVLVAFLAGCGGEGNHGFVADPMAMYFPFDGQRTWKYANDDPTVGFLVIGTLDPEAEIREDGQMEVRTIRYTVECYGNDPACVTGAAFRVGSLRISSDFSFGTLLHGADLAPPETYEPAVELTGHLGEVGGAWETESDGVTWHSVYDRKAPCDVPYDVGPYACMTLLVDDDADVKTPPSAHPLHGEWTAAPGYGLVAFQWRDDPERWRLVEQEWIPDPESPEG